MDKIYEAFLIKYIPSADMRAKIIEILDAIDNCVVDGAKRIEERIGGKDAIQLVTFAAHMRRIMAENPNLNLISVLS